MKTQNRPPSSFGSVAGNLTEAAITGEMPSAGQFIVDAAWDAGFGALFGVVGGSVDPSWGQIVKKGFGKFLVKQLQTETVSSIAEEILGNIISDIGRFTGERIVDMIISTFR